MTELPGAELGRAWRAGLAAPSVVHLDAAGSACPSQAVLDATIAHLRREGAVGGYAAEAEAAPTIQRARDHLGRLVGLDGAAVAFVPNATAAFVSLLGAWPLPDGARVGTLASEYENNRLALEALAARRGWELVALPTLGAGRLDIDRFAPAGLHLVTFPVVASHRGTVQPAAEALRRARDAGVPVLLDVAQAAGHVVVPPGADAYVGTARKWLRGPRGSGWLAVGPAFADLLTPEYPTVTGRDAAGAGRLAVAEASVAARVGLAVALDELAAAGPAAVSERIAALGALARSRLDGLAGWTVQEPLGEASGLVTLTHASLDPVVLATRLLAEGIATTAIPATRVPADLERGVLRVSLHAYCDEGDLDRLEFSLRR